MLPKVNFYFNSKQKEVLTIDNRFEQKYYYKQVLFFFLQQIWNLMGSRTFKLRIRIRDILFLKYLVA